MPFTRAWALALPLVCACACGPGLPSDRAVDARRELGASARIELVADIFVVAEPSGQPGVIEDETALLARAYRALLKDGFKTGPTRAVGIYLFPSWVLYDDFCARRWGERCASPFGFYARGERLIVIDLALGDGTLTHEIVHPLVEADFPGAPTWLDEGIASLFEAPTFDAEGRIHGRTNWRLPRLLNAIGGDAERPLARIDRLFGMSNSNFRDEHESLHYALARYLCQWLDERELLWSFYRKFRDGRADDPTGSRAFSIVTGTSPTSAQPAFKAWVESLRPPT